MERIILKEFEPDIIEVGSRVGEYIEALFGKEKDRNQMLKKFTPGQIEMLEFFKEVAHKELTNENIEAYNQAMEDRISYNEVIRDGLVRFA